MKLGLTLFAFLISLSSFAESVSFKIEALEGEIHSYGLRPEQAQVVMRCQFIKNGMPTKYSEKRPMTRLHILDQNADKTISRISVRSTHVWDFLPGFKLHNCSFNLIVLARNLKNEKLVMGDFIQLGQLNGQMSVEELKDITNTRFATDTLKASWNPLVLELKTLNGRSEVVIKE